MPAKRNNADHQSVAMALAAEEGRIADGLALLNDGTERAGCSWDTDLTVPKLNLAAVAHDPVAGRAAFEQFVSGPALADNWYTLGEVLQAVASSLDLGIPAEEIRTRMIDTFLTGHPARAELVENAEGLLALAEGDFSRAAERLRATLSMARECLPRFIEGSLHLSLATALLALGDRSGALAATHASIETLAKWPGWRRDRAEAMLARLEGTAVRPIGDLTARESEVAALIAEGLTNGQLAERLFISPKTAAVHVSNILAKLSLSSRTEIAAWSIRRDLPAAV